jgi:hypothetical protein
VTVFAVVSSGGLGVVGGRLTQQAGIVLFFLSPKWRTVLEIKAWLRNPKEVGTPLEAWRSLRAQVVPAPVHDWTAGERWG